MTPKDLISLAVDLGIAKDPRGKQAMETHLARRRQRFEELSQQAREDFDEASLSNPFGDTRLVVDGNGMDVEAILIGIDIGQEEVLMGDRLRQKSGKSLMVISHHASALGKAMASVWDTINVQIHMLNEAGVPWCEAERVTRELEVVKETNRREADLTILKTAENLEIPLASIHAPADLFAYALIRDMVNERRPDKVEDFLNMAAEIREFQALYDIGWVPKLKLGEASKPFQPTYFSLIGGWNPVPGAIELLARAGIRTLVMVECSMDLEEEARRHGINVVLLPHYPYDSLGLNLILNEILSVSETAFEIHACSNYLRVEETNRGRQSPILSSVNLHREKG